MPVDTLDPKNSNPMLMSMVISEDILSYVAPALVEDIPIRYLKLMASVEV